MKGERWIYRKEFRMNVTEPGIMEVEMLFREAIHA